MKRQIRNSVFESNSSSMHSLVVKKKDEYYTDTEIKEGMYLRDDGTWNIRSEDDLYFGRCPFGCLCTFESKVRYAIASLCAYKKDAHKTFEYISKIVKNLIPECKKIDLPHDSFNGKVSFGSVDEDILTGFLQSEGIDLKEFLTNKKYVVIVDGDEYCIWKDIKKCGLVDKNKIEKEYPNYEDY